MVKASITCRCNVKTEIEKKHASTGSEMMKVVQGMAKLILVTDRTCKVDIAAMQSLLGTEGEKVVAGKVMALMPAANSKEMPSLSAVCTSVASLLESELLRVLPASARGPATTAME
eukprot:3607021-Amphidinium_carterae.1